MRKIVYDICVPSEHGAGIRGFTDNVTVIIESGDPGGEKDGEYSFVEAMRKFLNEWYDGGRVEIFSDTAVMQYALKDVVDGDVKISRADPQVGKMKDGWKPNTTSDVYPVPDTKISRADRQKEAIKRMSVTVHCDPVLEAIAGKLLGICGVPEKYQADMIKAAAKAGAEALRNERKTEKGNNG